MPHFRFSPLLAIVVTAACASSGTSSQTSSPSPQPADATIIPQARTVAWPIKTREHVDLWLHGFALVQNDSSLVPLFKHGYREELTVLKNRANVISQLDANVDKLGTQIKNNRALINAQFIPLYFSSMEQMRSTIDRFVSVNGNPNSASSREEAAMFGLLSNYFQSPSDRAFLALFSSSLWDESAKFYHSYWMQQQRSRATVIDSVQGLWQNNVRPRIQRVLNNTQQRNGDIILSLPIGGEGRTILATGNTRTTTTVTFPDRPSAVAEVIYVVAHELIGSVATVAVTDNTTPAEQRNGVTDRLTSIAAVRGGLLMIEKSLPEFADGYARFYLTQAGRTPGTNPRAELAKLFPLPDAILEAITRQLDSVQGGI